MIASNRRRNQQAAAAVVAEEMESLYDYQEHIDEEVMPEIQLDSAAAGKCKSSVTNILSKHCSEVKNASDELVHSAIEMSKKKLKQLVHKHNNELFSFMAFPDRTPNVLGIAETIFRKYHHEIPTIKGNSTNTILRDLNLDACMNEVVAEFDKQLMELNSTEPIEKGLFGLMKQLRWVFQEYKTIGDEIIRLEASLYQKIEYLDKLHSRMPIILNLGQNEVLPELIDTFGKYAESVYQDSKIEDEYKKLVETYKKWNICRQIISLQNVMNQQTHEAQCSICLTEPVSFVIVPCGHTFCSNCSKKQNMTCYICRGSIRDRVKMYFT